MPTGGAPAPLTHDAFRQRQKSAELEGLSYKPLRVAWTDLEPVVLETLLDHFITGAPLFKAGTAAGIDVAQDLAFEEKPEDCEIIDQIKELIETRVRPAVANDGGDIIYKGYRDGHLYLSMHGACSGCPSSAVTLKRGIESLIKHYVPEVESVEAI